MYVNACTLIFSCLCKFSHCYYEVKHLKIAAWGLGPDALDDVKHWLRGLEPPHLGMSPMG